MLLDRCCTVCVDRSARCAWSPGSDDATLIPMVPIEGLRALLIDSASPWSRRTLWLLALKTVAMVLVIASEMALVVLLAAPGCDMWPVNSSTMVIF